MKQTPQDLRKQTLDLVNANKPATEVAALVSAWLASIDDDDLAGTAPDSLAPVLADGFTQASKRSGSGAQIARLRYDDGRGGKATALLILNDDMPYLVDSIVMAMRKLRVIANSVLNAVLPVTRNADGSVAAVGEHGAKLESYVLVLLSEDLPEAEIGALTERIVMVSRDAAVVRRDRAAMLEHFSRIGAEAAAQGEEGKEVAAFLEWAKTEGFEPFGYAYYAIKPGVRELERDIPSRIGVLQDTSHPVYGTCLANIPGDFDTLTKRAHTLSIVKADVEGTLHRDQQLDFIGIRHIDAQGATLGEYCFVGLFTRAGNATPLNRLPFARGRVARVLSIAGVRQEGFRAEKFVEILESLPRTEALEAEPEWLAEVCGAVVSLYKQPRAKVFARRDVYARHLNVLVYLPRERYSASVASALAKALQASAGAQHVSSQTLVADGPLARVYLIAHGARYPLDLETDIQQPLLAVMDGWHDKFSVLADAVSDVPLRASLRKMCATLPTDYVATTTPSAAFHDLGTILRSPDTSRINVRVEADNGHTTIRLYSVERVPSLSTILPALHNAGVAIDREQAHSLRVNGERHYVTSLSVDAASAAKLAKEEIVPVAEELFAALFNNEAEDGRLNGLVVEGGLSVREVQLVRAYMSYWRQASPRFSVRYMAETLRKQPALVKELVDAFLQRFDPANDDATRAAAVDKLADIKSRLPAINHADSEEVLGAMATLIGATLRTSYFQNGQQGDKIIFKFDTSNLLLVPEPRPFREIFVFSRRFEGVHLRGGPVARGGLRWSDRMEDYRTEVLGLVKAQMVKNAVIVPAGAKGGFVCKLMPKDATREVIAAEGEAVYRLFISSLLEVTDNRVLGNIVSPADTICYDGNDPYLVVAADKGTATFSDIANGIAVQRGFWLGDAFASGGSNGYDHKKMGITAKGAFEAVKRHFYEMDHDIHAQPVTMVGVGDMSGDVFGNGALLSRKLKIVAAFDHRHIFLDPNPDMEASFKERERMFALPRSSWEDYNKELISKGGGVFPRNARSIELSPEIRAALDIEETALAPEELMHRILLAPVDLFYNGGIGTYIKASTETHAQVKDRANDNIRVNGNELRCKVVTEGGNLGATQAGRIEFALSGGRIFTDAIDNSAGVDCSDHEVNAKMWLDVEMNAGQLSEADRNRILNEMTDDIERLVLRDNTLQTQLLVRELQAQVDADVQDGYAALIASLEEEGALSRELEQLPSVAELARRKADGRGLTTPELAVVIANVKNRYKRMLSALPLIENSWAESVLKPYFPDLLVATRPALAHPLANAILATVLANESVNRCGPLMLRQLAGEHGVDEADVILAWGQAWSALNLAPVYNTLDEDALKVPRAVSIKVDAHSRVLQKAVIEGALSVPGDQLRNGVGELTRLFANPETLAQLTPVSGQSEAELTAGLRAEFARAWMAVDAIEAVAAFVFAALSVSRPAGMDLPAFLQVGLALRAQVGIDTLERGLKLPATSRSQEQLRAYAQNALRRTQQRLLSQVLKHATGDHSALEAVEVVANTLGLSGYALATDLEQAMLDVWALSEAVNASTAALTA
ncbi:MULTISPECIES: NAD-glutamate dehydrogenase domain-containing protein [unclassified Duganella]|uniref:NAD-glutamate dehydrogenase domain-containing protein n=1 Tax=unclassified Duganella TaxID=2636909 RepID=UPI000888DE4B|nr:MULTISPECIES: NAD-glutamate dehydrogenase domain-containing protein [unclassified Duganella]SDG14602.1 glutamate dehydrogenase [Duganella sp. OV458]SDJ33492.1 glutamate dehydrogenase [Duganella sp. OV510]